MKVLPSKFELTLSKLNESYIDLQINNYNLKYLTTDTSDNYILQDLIENKAYATTLLYLNENYKLDLSKNNYLVNNTNINLFYEDCEELLNTNITIVEEAGIPLTNINGYNIYEGSGYILRGNNKKKIKESFEEEIDDTQEDISEEESEGTQCSDIAPKVDQDLNKPTTSKKKYYDILLSDVNENVFNFINKGFTKNTKGQYQRGNYILIKEGQKYIAIHKDKLKED
jgi:hypothetical protein